MAEFPLALESSCTKHLLSLTIEAHKFPVEAISAQQTGFLLVQDENALRPLPPDYVILGQYVDVPDSSRFFFCKT
ncbi:hypothetical protein T265_12404 [Opisthorchis viverrini]|uniref:Uncharacterized protein n=1 Tax=Opisthorchis viverrini TaxID=6198 RepID=A0A074YTE5_OPIVI|nr:hypothetical protein T265_12404 [Opisthorchis viverrini]KER17998.1 hypothetical protein T265_12404 [Opisthorchis viverrini]